MLFYELSAPSYIAELRQEVSRSLIGVRNHYQYIIPNRTGTPASHRTTSHPFCSRHHTRQANAYGFRDQGTNVTRNRRHRRNITSRVWKNRPHTNRLLECLKCVQDTASHLCQTLPGMVDSMIRFNDSRAVLRPPHSVPLKLLYHHNPTSNGLPFV